MTAGKAIRRGPAPAPFRIAHNAPMTTSSLSSSSVSPRAGGLLVVSIDRLPAWMLSSWGATWVSTPTFDRLAADGVAFDRLIATSTDPRLTLAELTAEGRLWRTAAEAGWPAAIVTDDRRLPERPAGVEVVEVPAVPASRPAEEDGATSLARLFARAEAIVCEGRHRLVWCHAGSLGVTWDAPSRYREAYVDPEDPPPPSGADVPRFEVTSGTDPDAVVGCRQAFAGQLTLLDGCLGGLVTVVRRLEPAWALAVVGLRGMPLGLHGEVGCGAEESASGTPYGESVHLPAVVVAPAGRMAGQRYSGLVIPADVGATLVELVVPPPAVEGPAPVCGARSLAGLLTSWRHEPRDRVVVAAGVRRALATPGWHLVVEPTAEGGQLVRLFAKPDDFFELSDVADRCPAVAEELSATLERAFRGDY